MSESADVVIIGGGVVGTASAYFLSNERLRVAIVEREALGSGSSAHGTGAMNVSIHFYEPPEHAHLMRQGTNYLKWIGPRVAEEAGVDILLRELPHLQVALTPDTWEYMKYWASKANLVELISAEEAGRLEPRLTKEIYGAGLQQGNGQVDAYRLTLAYAGAAEKHGAKVLNRNALGLERNGSRVTGVKTASGTIACDKVILALGPWSGAAAEWLDFPVAVAPIKGQAELLEYEGTEHWPYFVQSFDTTPGELYSGSLHKRMDGVVYCGTTTEEATFDTTCTEAARSQLLRKAVRLFPCMANAKLASEIAGPRSIPPNGTTVVGPVPNWEGVYLVISAIGIMTSALLGHILTDLVCGREPPVPIERFLPHHLAEPVKEVHGMRRAMAHRVG